MAARSKAYVYGRTPAEMWIRIPPGAWIFVCCECCVLSGKGLCDELITRVEESYRLCCVVVCYLETSWMWWSWPTGGLSRQKKEQKIVTFSVCELVLDIQHERWRLRLAVNHALHIVGSECTLGIGKYLAHSTRKRHLLPIDLLPPLKYGRALSSRV